MLETRTGPSPRKPGFWLPLLLTLWSGSGWAADPDAPRGFPVGSFHLHPFVGATTKWEDNIYKTENDPQSDTIYSIKPGLKFTRDHKNRHLTITTELETEYYQEHEMENNLGYRMDVEYHFEPNKRLKIDTEYEYLVEHDERGAPGLGVAKPSLGPNEWHQHTLKLTPVFTLNRLQANLNLSHSDRESGNNNQSLQDRNWNDVGMMVKWAFFPKTGLLMETGWKGITYDHQPAQDTQELRLMAGATWKLTGKTKGTFKFGATTKQYDSGNTPDATGYSWSTEAEWLPQEKTQLRFISDRRFQEGETGAFILTDYKLELEHHLRPRLSIKTGVSMDNSESGVNTQEDYLKTQLGLKYLFPRWFTLETSYFRNVKQSNQPGSGHESNGLTLTVNGSL